jgi:hypothetical protein
LPAGAVLLLKITETFKEMHYERVLCLRSACHASASLATAAAHLLHECISIQIQNLQTARSAHLLDFLPKYSIHT